MTAPPKKPYEEMGLLDFERRFPDEKACWEYLILARWPEGIACPGCKGRKFNLIQVRKVYECKKCHKQVSATAGTVFDKTRLPLRKWFWAIFLMATSKKGVSMLYLQRQLKIRSYRTAWLVGQKIRQAMTQRDALYTLKEDTVQADEIIIGGKRSFEAWQRSGTNKTNFLIMVDEDKKSKPRFVSFEQLETIYAKHLFPALKKKIKKGASLKTDGFNVYREACKQGYYHHKIYAHASRKEESERNLQWVNTLTSNLKRFLLSTYHGVNRKYHKAYLAEFAYRFNRRYWPDQAFDRLLYACIYSKPAPLPVLSA